MDHNEPVWFLLPSAIIKRLEDKTSQERQLPPNMISTVLARIRANPGRERELLEMARRIRQYVQDFPRGWGKWPNDINEALFVGLILGVGLARISMNKLQSSPKKRSRLWNQNAGKMESPLNSAFLIGWSKTGKAKTSQR